MEGYISTIVGWGPTWAPRNWFSCSGQLLAISQYTAFFSLIGTLYGGDGRTSFGLPDLRGRVPMGSGSGPGLTPRSNGQKSGAEYVTLNILEIPSHNHAASLSNASVAVPASTADGTTNSPTGNVLATGVTPANGPVPPGVANIYAGASTANTSLGGAAAVTGSVTVGYTGGNQSHLNLQPFQVILWIICYQGIFPSRN